ncbi:MAG: GNAT family N-acetyltransferase [Actinomycetota bacterium]|nr:GNAT family N-acetyltransferase [Actinomycetota bacterium]
MPVNGRAAGTVCRAGLDDAADLARLRYRWRVDEKGERGGEPEGFAADLRAWWEGHLGTHLAWLARVDGVAVGMAWLAVVPRVPGPEHFSRVAGNLQSVYVEPEHRGAGLASALVTAAVEHARRAGLGYLSVHPSERSYPVYRRAGFVETGKVLELGLAEPR